MNEHTIREISRVAWEVRKTYFNAVKQDDKDWEEIPEWDAANEDDQDEMIETVRKCVNSNLSMPVKSVDDKLVLTTIKALAVNRDIV